MTTYSDSLKLALIGDGEQTNVWGATTNTNLGTLLEQAIVGVQSIAMTGSADRVLTNLNGASDEARNAVLIITGASSGGYSVILPAGQQKTYIVTNSLTSGSVTIKPSGGTAVTIPNGVTMTIYTNGTSTQAVNYVDVAGVATTVANLPGGAAGYIPYQSAPNTTVYLTPGTAGYVLTTAGAGLPPYWNPSGTATLASNLAGGLAGQVAYQTGPNTTAFTLTGTPGQFLSSNGTSPPTWTSTIPTTINGLVAGNGSSFGLANSAQIVSTLGYTPYSNTNPSGFITSSGVAFTNVNNTFAGSGYQRFNAQYNGIALVADASAGGTTIGYASVVNSPSSYQMVFGYGVPTSYTVVGSIISSSSATAYITSSDRRLKSNIAPLTNSGSVIDAIQPRKFTWINTGEPGLGFIADELQQVVPNAVHGKSNEVDSEGKPRYQGIDASTPEMIALMIAELQSLRKRVAELEAKT